MFQKSFKGIFAAGLVSLSAASVIGAWHAGQIVEKSHATLRSDALLAADKVELLIRNMRLGAEAVASRLDLVDLDLSASLAWPSIRSENLGLRTVAVIDTDGIVRDELRQDGSLIGVDVSHREYFQTLKTTPTLDYHVGRPIFSVIDNSWVMPVSVPAYDEQGELAAVIVAGVGRNYFNTTEWRDETRDSRIYVHFADTGEIMVVTDQAGTADIAALDAAFSGPDGLVGTAGEIVELTIPGAMAYASASASDRFHVVASRDFTSVQREAFLAAMTFGSIGFAVIMTLLAMGLKWRDTALQARRDANELEVAQKRLRLATGAARIGVWDLDLTTGETTWDDVMHDLYEVKRSEAPKDNTKWRERLHPEDRDGHAAKLREAVETRSEYVDTFRIATDHGGEKIIHAMAQVVQNRSGDAVSIIGVNTDITEQVTREEALLEANRRVQHEALHDPLTNLGNRRALAIHLQHLKETADTRCRIACIHVDIDLFKQINDLHGHLAGDHVLCSVGAVLQKTCRPDDFVGRLGGDEFVVVLSGRDVRYRAREMAQSIVSACRKPLEFEDKFLYFGASVGISVGTAGTIESIVSNADIALYEAKRSGRNQYTLFTPQLRDRAEAKKRIADGLSEAISEDQISLVFQPQVDAGTHEIVGAEALVRWDHPEHGLISPATFLPVAEELGVIHEIDNIVLEKAVTAALDLRGKGLHLPRMAVNKSHRHLMQADLVDKVKDLGSLPFQLVFELLETISFDNQPTEIDQRLKDLRAAGVEIEVDDFGSGRASITTLLRVQPDRVKLDRQLVSADIISGRKAQSVLRAIVQMSDALGIDVTAEGVETEAHAMRAANLGCSVLQGYYFARPMTQDKLLAWATNWETQVPADHSKKPS